jgi:hypothetical protein
MKSISRLALVAVCLLIGPARADADLVTLDFGATVDFSQFSGGFTSTAGPVSLGHGITWNSTTADSVIGDGTYDLGANGSWNTDRDGFTGLNAETGSMTYTLDDPAKAVIAFLNYAPGFGPNVAISALGQDGTILESYDLTLLAPISTLDGTNEGAFRGIVRPTNDIYAFVVSNQFVVVDDLTTIYSGSIEGEVPEPATVLLLGLGLVAAGRKRFAR